MKGRGNEGAGAAPVSGIGWPLAGRRTGSNYLWKSAREQTENM